MRGLSFLAIGILTLLALILVEFLYLNFSIVESSSARRVIREILILENIDSLEFIKRSQEQALRFSFYKAYEVLGERGGSYDLSKVINRDGTAYWRVYDETKVPSQENMKTDLENVAADIFNKYMTQLESESITIPSYSVKVVEIGPTEIKVEAVASGNLKFEVKNVNISESGGFVTYLPSVLFSERNIGEEKFVQSDPIKAVIQNAINSIGKECGKESELNESIKNGINNLQAVVDGMEISIVIKNIIVRSEKISDNSCAYDAAADVIVSITNSMRKYPIGDKLKNIPLQFGIISGTTSLI